ncbi:hypothetical protein METH_17670 [Leisingera methylohalidivorans DSM 14336]|uniref:Uncharacterized protein n=1 Tax=Leisingera methylohalidivorans DSM 14336 TaxID=999552 RepID=V9W0U8_9RHOB|nr:hypothetical protein METH_17670 [Leisingera methylohalidivorans DSM 14336]
MGLLRAVIGMLLSTLCNTEKHRTAADKRPPHVPFSSPH